MSSIVVADAGPLHYLVLIDCGEILGNLFAQVLAPVAVRDEFSSEKTKSDRVAAGGKTLAWRNPCDTRCRGLRCRFRPRVLELIQALAS